MNKLITVFIFFLAVVTASAQSAYNFSVIRENPVTPVKNQASSGTCWCFSGVGLMESELIRMGKGEFDLSEMYIVRRNYGDKAQKYARLHGKINFAGGGSFADVLETLNEYGIVPEDAYRGLNYGSERHDHGELDRVLKGYMDVIVGARGLTPAWFSGFSGILDAYFGVQPETFTYQGKQYTPHTFKDFLGLKQEDYISLTSFTHHPFYAPFAIEIPDNWRWADSYNIPLDELMEVVEHALVNGYTVAWASDVSEPGFTREGIAVIPDENAAENAGSDQARWLGLSAGERDVDLRSRVGKEMLAEKTITPEMRQQAFDNFQTTDDHAMLIYGIAKDQKGNRFYMVKNSWGETGPYKGHWYASDPFVRYKTVSIVLHRKAIPAPVATKLGL